MSEDAQAPHEWDDIAIGTDLGSYEYVMTPEIIENYRRIVGNPKAAYPTVASRHGSHIFGLVYPDRWEHMNAGHESAYYNPPIPGKKIIVTGKVADSYRRRGKPYMVVETRAVDEDGRLIEVSRLIAIGNIKEVAKKWS